MSNWFIVDVWSAHFRSRLILLLGFSFKCLSIISREEMIETKLNKQYQTNTTLPFHSALFQWFPKISMKSFLKAPYTSWSPNTIPSIARSAKVRRACGMPANKATHFCHFGDSLVSLLASVRSLTNDGTKARRAMRNSTKPFILFLFGTPETTYNRFTHNT